MVTEIDIFIKYLQEVKKMSRNTVLSYHRDLLQMASYMGERGITEAGKVTKTSLTSYILFMEKEGKATTTISRMRSFTMNFQRVKSDAILQSLSMLQRLKRKRR